DVTEILCYPEGKQDTEYIIPDGVNSIDDWAFDHSDLTSITIPESVTSIGDAAFQSCENLTSISIPEGVTSIGTAMFNNCSSLTSITIPESVTSIGEDAFYNCDSLTISGYTGSYAETYALENDIPFVPLEVETSESVEIVVVKLADDGTDEVNVNDLGVLIQIFTEKDTTTMTPEIEKADVYKDGILNVSDITMFKRYIIKNANK
ncbi:MAG: leucine-rich repeat protein, partial [Oscillospiraceae bacterium]|nr:leucine-rich repeat protein [Oscillospiraceae bacterium]